MAVQRSGATALAPRKEVSESADALGALETGFLSDRGLVLAALNLAIEEADEKREGLAAHCGMSKGQFSKVTNGGSDRADLQCVLDNLPYPVFVAFMKHYGRARGVRVTEVATEELTEAFFDAVNQMLRIGKLLMVRRPTPVKAGLR